MFYLAQSVNDEKRRLNISGAKRDSVSLASRLSVNAFASASARGEER
jgi:hypothetical protein